MIQAVGMSGGDRGCPDGQTRAARMSQATACPEQDGPLNDFADDPDLPVLWAAAWQGSRVRCLFHHDPRPGCPACSTEQDRWELLHRTTAFVAEMLNVPEKNGSTQMVVLIREREMQLTAVNADGPYLTVAIPPGPDVRAAQAWIERWAALKFGRRVSGMEEYNP